MAPSDLCRGRNFMEDSRPVPPAGRAIGKLEVAFVWKKNVVCNECYGRLGHRRTALLKRPSIRVFVVFAIVMMAIVVYAAVDLHGFWHRRDSTATITGSIWLTKNDANSQLMRGIRVCLLRPTARVAAVHRAFKATANDLAYEHEHERVDTTPAVPDLAVKMNLLRGSEANVVHDVSVDVVYAQLRATAPFSVPAFSGIIIDSLVTRVKSDVDGKYIFEGVQSGSYFVYAEFSSKAMIVEWLIPVVVERAIVKLDVNNSNAASILNIPEDIGAVATSGGKFTTAEARNRRDYRDNMRRAVAIREEDFATEGIK